MTTTTLGSYIAGQRKKLGLSQKDLAQRILREEGGAAISPQYLNDIERDRRQPSSDYLLRQFASVLGADADYLAFLSGSILNDIRAKDLTEDEFKVAFRAFRKS